MFREKIPARQLGAWLFAAMVPVAVQILGGDSWVWVGCAVVIVLLVADRLWHRPCDLSKWGYALQYIYVTILLGELLSYTAQSWPVGNSDPAVPLILLALAVWSVRKGPVAAARVGAVLFWVVLGLYLVVFAAGGMDVRISWLVPQWDEPDLLGVTILLLPSGTAGLLKERGSLRKQGALSAGVIFAGVALTAGVMSPGLAKQLPNAFYEMCRGLELLSVARRFEALICAGTTMGWFALISLFLTLCGSCWEKNFQGRGKHGVWICATAAALWKLCGLHINSGIALFSGAVFWVGIPLLTQGLEKIKKS